MQYTQACRSRPKESVASSKDRAYFLPVTAPVRVVCVCVCDHSEGLSSTTGLIATASRAEENCSIQAHRIHLYGNQFIWSILIWLQVCRSHHLLRGRALSCIGTTLAVWSKSAPKITFPVTFLGGWKWLSTTYSKWTRGQSCGCLRWTSTAWWNHASLCFLELQWKIVEFNVYPALHGGGNLVWVIKTKKWGRWWRPSVRVQGHMTEKRCTTKEHGKKNKKEKL